MLPCSWLHFNEATLNEKGGKTGIAVRDHQPSRGLQRIHPLLRVESQSLVGSPRLRPSRFNEATLKEGWKVHGLDSAHSVLFASTLQRTHPSLRVERGALGHCPYRLLMLQRSHPSLRVESSLAEHLGSPPGALTSTKPPLTRDGK